MLNLFKKKKEEKVDPLVYFNVSFEQLNEWRIYLSKIANNTWVEEDNNEEIEEVIFDMVKENKLSRKQNASLLLDLVTVFSLYL